MPCSGWSVALTYGSSERKAVGNLVRQGYEAFCPLVSRRSRSDIRRTIESPLFPCYVFVKIAPQQLWSSINSTYGVVHLLTNRDQSNPKPLFVDDTKIDEILTLHKAAEDPFPIGTLVRVRGRSNPFYDLTGTILSMNKLMKISVLMNIFNRDVVVEFVNPAELEKL